MAFTGLPPRPADSKGRTWVFHPPPGWPEAPAEWRPPYGWAPDPSWPPAPAEWDFWLPVRRRERRGAGFYIKAAAGVCTFAATLVGVYFAYRAINPPEITTTSWVRHANAVCDQDTGALSSSLNNGLAPFMGAPTGSAAPASPVGLITAVVSADGDLSKVVGDLAAIPAPQDSRAPEVQAVLSKGNALVDSLKNVASVVQNAALTHTFTPQVTSELKNAINHVRVADFDWQKAIATLGLTRCPFWVRDPHAVPALPKPLPAPVSSSPAGSLSNSEQQLVSRLNTNYLTGCTGRPDQEGGNVIAAVNCHPVEAGPTLKPLVVQFPNLTAERSWFSANTTGFTDTDNCAAGSKLGSWTYYGVTAGLLGCTDEPNGDFRMVWVIDSALVGVIADGANGSAMTAWWVSSGYVVSGQG